MVTTPSMIGVLRRGCRSAVTHFCCMPPPASITASSVNCQIASQHLEQLQPPCLQIFCHHLHSCQAPAASQVTTDGQNAPKAPWTPTAQLTKRKLLTKRMGFLLQTLEAEQAAATDKFRKLPEFGPGDTIEVKVAVPENRRKVALMKGVVIARKNRGWQSAFTIRNYLGNAGGIERTFPL
ncbi:TPA: hypothetical protein ACH3X1_001555 [Trebouxia sp. C0004]